MIVPAQMPRTVQRPVVTGVFLQSALRAAAIRNWQRRQHAVFCYFDNDHKSAAPQDAQWLIRQCASKRATRGGA